MHDTPSEFAGKTVRIKKSATHRRYPDFGGSEIRIEDWQDRVMGGSWMICDGNPVALIYAMRSADNDIPTDNDVLYGQLADGLACLLHISEIEV